jgi:hypothetical protein
MKTTTEVRLQKQGDKEMLQFIAAKMNYWDVTGLVDTSKLDVEGLKKKARTGSNEPVFIDVEISDRTIEQVITKLWGSSKDHYLQSVYGIPESFRFP